MPKPKNPLGRNLPPLPEDELVNRIPMLHSAIPILPSGKAVANIPSEDSLVSTLVRLEIIAGEVKGATENFRETVDLLNQTLQRLNVGVAAWITISIPGEAAEDQGVHQLGYDRLSQKLGWVIGLRTVVEDAHSDEDLVSEQWPFNDAPRQRRLEAIKYIPSLIEAITHNAQNLLTKVQEEADRIKRVADALAELTGTRKA